MGWWSDDIMGGDPPYDIQAHFEELAAPVTPEKAIELISKLAKEWYWEEPIIKQVVGFQMIERGYEMSDALRALVIDGIDNDESDDWNDPEKRKRKLAEFKAIVLAYPAEGAEESPLPHQEGLFEVIFNGEAEKHGS